MRISNRIMKQKHCSYYIMYHGTVLAEQVLNCCLFESDYSYVSYCTLCFGNCTGQFPVGATVRSSGRPYGR